MLEYFMCMSGSAKGGNISYITTSITNFLVKGSQVFSSDRLGVDGVSVFNLHKNEDLQRQILLLQLVNESA